MFDRAMFTVSRFAKSSLLVLLAAALTTAAYARGGGHSGSNGSTSSGVRVQFDARLVAGNGNQTLPKGSVAHPGFVHRTIVRDHRGDSWTGIPNSYPICSNGCAGEGGLSNGTRPAPQQPNSYGPRDGQVNDHRTGGSGQVHDHRT